MNLFKDWMKTLQKEITRKVKGTGWGINNDMAHPANLWISPPHHLQVMGQVRQRLNQVIGFACGDRMLIQEPLISETEHFHTLLDRAYKRQVA